MVLGGTVLLSFAVWPREAFWILFDIWLWAMRLSLALCGMALFAVGIGGLITKALRRE